MASPDPVESDKTAEEEQQTPSTQPGSLWSSIKPRLIGEEATKKNGCLEPFVKLFQIIGPLATATALIFVMIQSCNSGRNLDLLTESSNRTWSAELLERIYQEDLPVQAREEAVREYLAVQSERRMPVRLREANFSGMMLAGERFGSEELKANLRGAKFNDADLRGVWLVGADLENAQLKRADLREADLRSARLMSASAQETKFHDANLCGAILEGSNFFSARFDRADLRSASLVQAKMIRAVLEGTDVRGAAFSEFEPATGIGQRGADLRWSRFANAIFDDRTYLRGADVRGAFFDSPLKFAPRQTDCTVKSEE